MIELSDQDILARLTDTEDSTAERKTANDYRDCLKTAVAFSNSLPVNDPGIIFVGVYDDGRVEKGTNLEKLQKDVSKELNKVYPAILPQQRTLRDAQGNEFLVVIVRGSENRPHFGGPSYIRDGTQTKEASEQQFERLIAERNNKVRKILEWYEREITVRIPWTSMALLPAGNRIVQTMERVSAVVVGCNQHYVTAELKEGQRPNTGLTSWPLAAIMIGFDNEQNRLELILAEELSIKRVKL